MRWQTEQIDIFRLECGVTERVGMLGRSEKSLHIQRQASTPSARRSGPEGAWASFHKVSHERNIIKIISLPIAVYSSR